MMEYRGAAQWRVFIDVDGSHYMYFDAAREAPATRDLTRPEMADRLDKLSSVSAVPLSSDQLELIDGCDGSQGEPPSSFQLFHDGDDFDLEVA